MIALPCKKSSIGEFVFEIYSLHLFRKFLYRTNAKMRALNYPVKINAFYFYLVLCCAALTLSSPYKHIFLSKTTYLQISMDLFARVADHLKMPYYFMFSESGCMKL